jgi:membrane associated rhomboid family serine protease
MAAGTLAHLRRHEADAWVLLAFLAGKLAYEHWAGPLPFSGTADVVTAAHLFGVIGGAAVAACLRLAPLPL